jgi:predicted transposase YbfD/YdcC
MPAIEGAVVTIDAIGCQRDLARKIIDKKADDVLALKGHQGRLRDERGLFATEQKARGYADTTISVDATVDGDHGRIETRAHRNPSRHRRSRYWLAAGTS